MEKFRKFVKSGLRVITPGNVLKPALLASVGLVAAVAPVSQAAAHGNYHHNAAPYCRHHGVYHYHHDTHHHRDSHGHRHRHNPHWDNRYGYTTFHGHSHHGHYGQGHGHHGHGHGRHGSSICITSRGRNSAARLCIGGH